MQVKATGDNILCSDGDFGDVTTKAGIIIKSTIGKTSGANVPRWFKVLSVGPDINWLTEGEWVLVEYGRWTEGLEANDDRLEPRAQIWKVDPKGCLATSNEKPETYNINPHDLDAQRKIRD